jgi:hypothetical protein
VFLVSSRLTKTCLHLNLLFAQFDQVTYYVNCVLLVCRVCRKNKRARIKKTSIQCKCIEKVKPHQKQEVLQLLMMDPIRIRNQNQILLKSHRLE